jgi:hypothetical protein
VTSDRKDERLLWDCATVARFLDSDRPPAQTRLNTKVGENLAQILLTTLRNTELTITHGRAHRPPLAG